MEAHEKIRDSAIGIFLSEVISLRLKLSLKYASILSIRTTFDIRFIFTNAHEQRISCFAEIFYNNKQNLILPWLHGEHL